MLIFNKRLAKIIDKYIYYYNEERVNAKEKGLNQFNLYTTIHTSTSIKLIYNFW